jgi:DNA-binding NarL/FixJ family response regulator
MSLPIAVRVLGPHLRRAMYEQALQRLPIPTAAPAEREVVLLICEEWHAHLEALTGASGGHSRPPAVLVVSRRADIARAQACGIEGLVSEQDAEADLYRAIQAAAHRERFQGPRLLSQAEPTRAGKGRPAFGAVRKLTAGELEAALPAARGQTIREIAADLDLSVYGVKFRLTEVRRKLGAARKSGLGQFLDVLEAEARRRGGRS